MCRKIVRKIVLLSVVAVLAVVYAVQIVSEARTNVRVVATDGDIDFVLIDNNGTRLSIVKENDGWFVGESKEPCQLSRANGIVNAISEIKILGSVSSGSAADNERYGFDSAIVVEAYGATKLLRRIVVGKNTATGSQCYARLDDKSSIFLVQGALRSIFEVTEDNIKEKKSPEKEGTEEESQAPQLETM